MKKYLFLLVFGVASVSLWAQQDHHYTQFMYNKLLLNPGYAGAREVPSLTAIYRNQWIGFKGAPKSALASFNTPIFSKRQGVGITMSSRSIGLQRDFLASLAYAYDVISSKKMSLRVGLNGSLRSLGFDLANAHPQPGSGPYSDPSIGDQRINDFYGNVGAGIYATYDQRVYLGFSVPRIYTNVIGYNPSGNTPA
ncbi:MAG TPA: PorP/SprF family type IX secretion system membrane protein, partial [Saprospiraceae bacterium]|nr:PorP/SprF family type IX secretion system membrane protein [Saprospiraceae bacterium]